jgi:parvulin-like peptidyl-prolyl isomerase
MHRSSLAHKPSVPFEESSVNSTDKNEFFDFSKANNRRSFALLAIGALVGLGIAGFGLFTAKGTATNTLPPEDIALVNQRPIYRSDFVIQAQTQYSMPFAEITHEQRAKVLDDMINEELMVQRGLEVDLPGYDPDVRAALVTGVELQIYADVLAKQPTEEELKAYYEKNRDKYSSIGVMQLRDLVLSAKSNESSDEVLKAAQDAVAELRAGAKVDAVVAKFGLHDSGKLMQGGKPDLGDIFDFAAEANLGPKLYAASKKLQAGQVSDPINDTDGVHIIFMTVRKPPVALDFEQVRSRVWTDIKNEAQEKIRVATLKYFRNKADILAAKDY